MSGSKYQHAAFRADLRVIYITMVTRVLDQEVDKSALTYRAPSQENPTLKCV